MTPRELASYMRVFELGVVKGTFYDTTRWPGSISFKDMVKGNLTSLLVLTLGYISMGFWPYVFPFILLRDLYRWAFKRHQWRTRDAWVVGQDLMRQCVARLAATSLGDQPSKVIATHSPLGEDRVHTEWSVNVSSPSSGHARLKGNELFESADGTVHSRLVLDLIRPDGQAPTSPERWPDWLDEAPSWQGSRLELRFSEATEERFKTLKGKRGRSGDTPRRVAELLGEVLRLNGFQATTLADSRGAGVSLMAGAARDAAPPAPTRAPLAGVRLEPAVFSLKEALKRHRRGITQMALHTLPLPVGLLGTLSLLCAMVAMFAIGAEPIARFISGGVSCFLLLLLWWLVSSAMPKRASSQTRSEAQRDELVWSGDALEMEGARVNVEEPFVVQLSRAPEGGHMLNVVVQQRGAGVEGRVAFCVPASPTPSWEALPQLDVRAPTLAPSDFEAWVWPLLSHHSEFHGQPLDWHTPGQALTAERQVAAPAWEVAR